MTEGGPRGPLAGVRVIEFAQALAIPMCGVMLSDMGAEVIKVEPPAGDAFRHNMAPIIPGESKGFTVVNRGKRSVCVDIGKPEAKPVVEALVKSADVVLVAFKPPDVPRYHLTYDELRAVNPEIIYLEHVPLGPKGPLGDSGGYDVLVQGISGTGAITARSNGERPESIRPAYNDVGTGFLSALGVTAALLHREQTGAGQRVETSLLSTSIAFGNQLVNWFAATDPPVLETLEKGLAQIRSEGGSYEQQRQLWSETMIPGGHANIYFRHYKTSDGFVSVGCLSPALNARFRSTTGIADPRIDDSNFDLDADDSFDRLTVMVRAAEDLFRTKTTAAWIEALRGGGVPCSPFNFPTEVVDDPQVQANGYMIDLDHPALGPYKTFAPPLRMDRTPVEAQGSSPLLDADTDVVLNELGFTADQIEGLRADGVVGH